MIVTESARIPKDAVRARINAVSVRSTRTETAMDSDNPNAESTNMSAHHCGKQISSARTGAFQVAAAAFWGMNLDTRMRSAKNVKSAEPTATSAAVASFAHQIRERPRGRLERNERVPRPFSPARVPQPTTNPIPKKQMGARKDTVPEPR